jgi:hypothetical protein
VAGGGLFVGAKSAVPAGVLGWLISRRMFLGASAPRSFSFWALRSKKPALPSLTSRTRSFSPASVFPFPLVPLAPMIHPLTSSARPPGRYLGSPFFLLCGDKRREGSGVGVGFEEGGRMREWKREVIGVVFWSSGGGGGGKMKRGWGDFGGRVGEVGVCGLKRLRSPNALRVSRRRFRTAGFPSSSSAPLLSPEEGDPELVSITSFFSLRFSSRARTKGEEKVGMAWWSGSGFWVFVGFAGVEEAKRGGGLNWRAVDAEEEDEGGGGGCQRTGVWSCDCGGWC